jgi:hypothetical protein
MMINNNLTFSPYPFLHYNSKQIFCLCLKTLIMLLIKVILFSLLFIAIFIFSK